MNWTASFARSPAPEVRGPSRRLGTLCLAAVALVAASLAAQPARASVTLTSSTKFDGGIGVTAKFVNPSTEFNVNTAVGRFTTTWKTTDPNVNPHISWTGGSFLSYCVDIATFLESGKDRFGQVSVTSSTNTDGKGVVRDIGAAGWVFNTYAQKKNQTETQWLSFLSNLAVPGGFAGTLTVAQAHAALQLSIWEAAYDPNGAKSAGDLGYLDAGSLTFSGNAVNIGSNSDPKNRNVVRLANYILGARKDDPLGVSEVGLIDYAPNSESESPTNQDQLFEVAPDSVQAVPEPSTLAMVAVGGLIGLGMVRRERLKASKATA